MSAAHEISRNELDQLFADWFSPHLFKDYAENGLQVEGRSVVNKVVCGVSANRALIEAAIEQKADAIFVHHGLVWGGIQRIDGWLKTRIKLLLENEISLFAYHLPLDAHATLGNNAGLVHALGATSSEPWGDHKGQTIGMVGTFDVGDVPTLGDVVQRHKDNVGKPLVVFGDLTRKIRRMGAVSGAAPDMIHAALKSGFDLFITGEVTEWVQSISDEANIAFIAGGHHQTERFGAQRVAMALREKGIEALFVDIENPA